MRNLEDERGVGGCLCLNLKFIQLRQNSLTTTSHLKVHLAAVPDHSIIPHDLYQQMGFCTVAMSNVLFMKLWNFWIFFYVSTATSADGEHVM